MASGYKVNNPNELLSGLNFVFSATAAKCGGDIL